jgi:hypothetical protein
MYHGPRQTPFSRAHQKPHPGIFDGDRPDNFMGAVAAVIVDDQNFKINLETQEDSPHAAKKKAQILCFAQRGQDERQLFPGSARDGSAPLQRQGRSFKRTAG